MSRYLAFFSLLLMPFAIHAVFGWLGVWIAVLALLSFVFKDVARFYKERIWRERPINKTLRAFGLWCFGTLSSSGKSLDQLSETDLARVVPETFRSKELYPIVLEYQKLLSSIRAATEQFESKLKMEKGTSLTADEVLFVVGEIERAARNLRREFSPEQNEAQVRSEFFRLLGLRLNIGLDGRGQPIGHNGALGPPQSIHSGIRFRLEKGPLDVLHLDKAIDCPSNGFWIGVGPQYFNAVEYLPDDLDGCIKEVKSRIA